MSSIISKPMGEDMLSISVSEKKIDSLLEGTSRSFFLKPESASKENTKAHRSYSTYWLVWPTPLLTQKLVKIKLLLQGLKEYNTRIQDSNKGLPDFTSLAEIQENGAEAELLSNAMIPVNYFEKSDKITDSDREENKNLSRI